MKVTFFVSTLVTALAATSCGEAVDVDVASSESSITSFHSDGRDEKDRGKHRKGRRPDVSVLVALLEARISPEDIQDTVNQAYATDAVFRGPVWGVLTREQLAVKFQVEGAANPDIEVARDFVLRGRKRFVVSWRASYEFSGRPVQNEVRTFFTFNPKTGRITRQVDRFDPVEWVLQALPLTEEQRRSVEVPGAAGVAAAKKLIEQLVRPNLPTSQPTP